MSPSGPPRPRGPWYGRSLDCIRFEGQGRLWPGLKIQHGGGGRTYHVRMEVPHYEPRHVEIRFEKWSKMPRVRADGPGSLHRYGDGTLCMWYPPDPDEEKWVFEDGLLALLNHIQAHLFREAWWREHAVWLGPQAPHGPPKQPGVEDAVDAERDAAPHGPERRQRR